MHFGLRHSFLAKFKWTFLILPLFVYFVVVRHIPDYDRSQLRPQDV